MEPGMRFICGKEVSDPVNKGWFQRSLIREAMTPAGNRCPVTYARSFHIGNYGMTAIVYSFVRASTRVSDLALLTAFSLGGVVLTLALAHFGLDISPSIPG
jgi:hypothetical protein